MKQAIVLLLATLILLTTATTYFSETFGDGWENRWVVSSWKQSEGTAGKFVKGAAVYSYQEGLKTSEDAKFYAISAEYEPFSNEGKTLVFQFSISHPQNIDCGGGYVKLLPPGFDKENFNGDTDYNIMFGPDICGSTRRTHVILSHEGKNFLVDPEVKCESDQYTHVYTLIIRPDNTYVVKIDGEEKQSGSIEEHWDILPPKTIPDPAQSKPADWVDLKRIADPEDKKPEDWDNQPAEIADPEAKKPEDWDDSLDGDWVAPTIPNPEYQGEWRAKMIDNPDYQGEWVHPEIPNPDYAPNPNLYKYKFGGVGIEIWQVKSGTVFDNILITDSEEEAEAAVTEILAQQASEKENKKTHEKVHADAQAAAHGHSHEQEHGDIDNEILFEDPELVKEDL